MKAQAEATAAVAAGCLEGAEDFQAADHVFHQHAISGQQVVMRFLLRGERRLKLSAAGRPSFFLVCAYAL